jgi:hypothetical protein
VKRSLAILVLGGFCVFALRAGDPPADRPDEPVRLKKKKKDDQPPPAEEPKAEEPRKPDKPRGPVPWDDEPGKPSKPGKPDAEAQPEMDEQEVLQRILKNSRTSEERLANKEVNDGTKQIQRDILSDLDKLIELSQRQEDQDNKDNQDQSSDSQPQGGTQSQPQGGSSSSKQAREQRRKQRQQQSARQQRGQPQSSDPTKDPSGPSDQGGNGGNGAGTVKKPTDDRLDLWGHLDEKERLKMNKYMEEKFMEKYDELTKQYYRALAEKSRQK